MTMDERTEVVHVTPEMAKAWLERNENRDITSKRVDDVVGWIERGEWALTNDAIVIDRDGILRNGQHRLMGIVKTNKTLPLNVMTNADPLAQDVMDTGRRRSLADALTMRKEINTNQLAAVIRRVHCKLSGIERWHVSTNSPSIPQGLRLLEEYPELREAATVGREVHIRSDGLMPPSVPGFLWWYLGQIEDDDEVLNDRQGFFDRICTGADLHEDHPILRLRQTLTREYKDRRRGSRIEWYMIVAYTIKAWNLYRTGQDCKLLRWRAGGEKAEPFPEPI